MTAETLELGYTARQQFVDFHARTQRFACLVCHRRAGKTVACVHDLLDGALRCEKVRPRFAYVAPFLKQAKSVAWDYLRAAVAPLRDMGATINESELRADCLTDRKCDYLVLITSTRFAESIWTDLFSTNTLPLTPESSPSSHLH